MTLRTIQSYARTQMETESHRGHNLDLIDVPPVRGGQGRTDYEVESQADLRRLLRQVGLVMGVVARAMRKGRL